MSATAHPVSPVVPRRSWSARLLSLPTVMGMALVSFLFLFTGTAPVVSPMGDPDIWWHLRNAAQLISSGHFIRADSWSFTVAGTPWINFEWLAELPYYAAWRALGDRGLYLVMMLAVSAIVAGIYWLACLRSHDCKAAFVACFIGLHFVTVSLGPRTLLFGWLFLVLELGILWSLQKGRDHTAWLPLLFLLWINTHGSWLIGFVLMLVFFACGCVQGAWGSLSATRWTRAQMRRFLLIAVLSFAVLFVNPYGWHTVTYPFDLAFHQKLNVEHVAEWYSINFHNFRGKATLATLLLFGVLQLVRRRQWTLQDLALLLIALYAGFTYVRFLFLLGIVLVPLLAMELTGLVSQPYEAEKDKPRVNAIAMAVLLLVIVGFWPGEKKIHAGISEANPEKALPYIRSLAGQGNVLNDFEWGGYLEWNAPAVKEFMDGRVDIFEHKGVLADYLQAINLQDPYAVLDKYRILYVVLPQGQALGYLLAHSAAWKTAYHDDQTVVFERVP
jgi:hypothetical protein